MDKSTSRRLYRRTTRESNRFQNLINLQLRFIRGKYSCQRSGLTQRFQVLLRMNTRQIPITNPIGSLEHSFLDRPRVGQKPKHQIRSTRLESRQPSHGTQGKTK